MNNVVQTVIMGVERHDQHGSVCFALCDSGRVKETVSVDPSSFDSTSHHEFNGVTSLNEVHSHLSLVYRSKATMLLQIHLFLRNWLYGLCILVGVLSCNPDTSGSLWVYSKGWF